MQTKILNRMSSQQHIVIPGQVIATSNDSDHDGGGFLRGHGTYIETTDAFASSSRSTGNDNDNLITETENDADTNEHHNSQNYSLIASISGTIERTNKLLTIQPLNRPYAPQMGDPIIGRIISITNQAWKVSTMSSPNCGVSANLPLTGIFLKDGMQRIRTSADALRMRAVLKEGDLVSAEVRGVGRGGGAGGSGGRITLHARSVRCGKLENGCVVFVPCWLIGRRKKHFVVLGDSTRTKDGFEGVRIEVLLGCNGGIWIQKALVELENLGTETPLPEVVQSIRSNHAETPLLLDERRVVARVRNAVEALKLVQCQISPENIEKVVKVSAIDLAIDVKDMLKPDAVVRITQCTRNR